MLHFTKPHSWLLRKLPPHTHTFIHTYPYWSGIDKRYLKAINLSPFINYSVGSRLWAIISWEYRTWKPQVGLVPKGPSICHTTDKKNSRHSSISHSSEPLSQSGFPSHIAFCATHCVEFKHGKSSPQCLWTSAALRWRCLIIAGRQIFKNAKDSSLFLPIILSVMLKYKAKQCNLNSWWWTNVCIPM